MEETPTRRYVDAILEATGLLRKGRLNLKGLEGIRRMDDKGIRTFADTLWEQVHEHYKRNLPFGASVLLSSLGIVRNGDIRSFLLYIYILIGGRRNGEKRKIFPCVSRYRSS